MAKTASPAITNLTKEKLEKFRKPGSCIGTSSPDNSEQSSVKSAPGNFKTPTLPKRSKTLTSATKIKPKAIFNHDQDALKEKTVECENKTKYIHQLTKEIEQYKNDLENVKLEKEELQREYQNELQDLEFEMLQTMTKLQKHEEEMSIKIKELDLKYKAERERCEKEVDYRLGQLVLDYEIKIKDLEENSSNMMSAKIEELENHWREKLKETEAEHEAILKECQAISEYSIIECELEKKEIQIALDEARSCYDKLQKKYTALKYEQETLDKSLGKSELELKQKIVDLSRVITKQEEELHKLKSEVKAYEITISNSQVTIDVLKRRLIDSDRDVEQLKEELSRCEEKLVDSESRCLLLNNDLNEFRKQSEDLELQYESSIQLNKEAIESLRKDLLDKVKLYENQVKSYSAKINKEQALKQQIMDQLNSNIEVIKHINLEVERTEEFYAVKTKTLQEVIDCYKAQEKSWTNQLNELEIKNSGITKSLSDKDAEITDLNQRLNELEAINNGLKDKCTYYKSKAEEFEAESKESSQTRKKYIEISGKYDALLQEFEHLEMENLKNKSKLDEAVKKVDYLVKIQDEFDKLQKEKEVLEDENMFYKLKLDDQKLKKYKIASKDKENLGSPNRSFIESPNRASPFRGSPFRERNNN